VVVLPFFVLIVAEPDLGTSVCIAIVAFILLFTAGMRYSYAVGALLSGIPVLFLLVYFFPYRLKRVLVFLDPWKDPLGAGFQITQSLIALGSGGLFGLGLMEGKQKLFYLPEPHTDFVFSVIGEERGLLGTVTILLFGFFLGDCGCRCGRPTFGCHLGVGLTDDRMPGLHQYERGHEPSYYRYSIAVHQLRWIVVAY
jgi:cell division protein FtsW